MGQKALDILEMYAADIQIHVIYKNLVNLLSLENKDTIHQSLKTKQIISVCWDVYSVKHFFRDADSSMVSLLLH